MILHGGGLRRANQASARAAWVGTAMVATGANISIPAAVKIGDLVTVHTWGGNAPTGGAGEAWRSASGYSGIKIWFRVLRAADFVTPINVGSQAAYSAAIFYRGVQSVVTRVDGGGQGPPAARLLPGFVKNSACRGFISHQVGQSGVAYGVPSSPPGFNSNPAGWAFGDAYIVVTERYDYQSYVDNYQMPITIATSDPAQQRVHIFELLAY